MNNVSKTWVDPININASELNRIEQLIMNTHSNTAILNGEVSTLQNRYLQLSTSLNSILGSQDTLKTLSELTKLASNNLDILDTLNNTTKLVKASSQEFTKEELSQIYDNLNLNSFLHLKDIRVNGESVIKGSIADIQIATIINNTQSSSSSSSSGSSNSSSDTGSIPSGGTVSNKLADMIQDDLHQTISQEDRDKWDLITKAVFNETDPTVPNWAKQESKPTYLYEEILNRPQKLSELTDDLNYATPSYVDTKVSDLQELLLGPGSTEAIDTIQELATELQNNSEILDALNQAITNKAPKDHTHTKSDITDFAHNQSITTITNSAGNTFTSAKVASSVSHTGWTNNATDDRIIPTMSFLAYWNGAHTSSNSSNLQYCKYGEIVGTTTNQTISGIKTFNAPTNSAGVEQTTMKIKTSNGGAIIFGKEGVNSGTMIKLEQTDGTCRLRFRSSATAGAMVWEQPEQGAQLYVDLGASGSDYRRITFPSSGGTLALTSQIPSSSTYLPLTGGTMAGPIVLSGGDATTGVGNIQLDTTGQITAKGTTQTLFGRTSASNLILGHSSHALTIRGSATRPTYNDNELALKSDIGDHKSLVSRGNVTCETGTTRPAVAGLSMSHVYSNGFPTSYGNLITMKGTGDSQILIGWSGTSGAFAPAYIRSKRDSSSANWSAWGQICTSQGGVIDSGCTLTINGTLVI